MNFPTLTAFTTAIQNSIGTVKLERIKGTKLILNNHI